MKKISIRITKKDEELFASLIESGKVKNKTEAVLYALDWFIEKETAKI